MRLSSVIREFRIEKMGLSIKLTQNRNALPGNLFQALYATTEESLTLRSYEFLNSLANALII